MNQYLYCSQNPVNKVDPLGLDGMSLLAEFYDDCMKTCIENKRKAISEQNKCPNDQLIQANCERDCTTFIHSIAHESLFETSDNSLSNDSQFLGDFKDEIELISFLESHPGALLWIGSQSLGAGRLRIDYDLQVSALKSKNLPMEELRILRNQIKESVRARQNLLAKAIQERILKGRQQPNSSYKPSMNSPGKANVRVNNLGKVMAKVGGVLIIISIVEEGCTVYASDDPLNETVKAALRLEAAYLGAQLGGTLGLFGGPVGVIIGGFLGGSIGYITGDLIGNLHTLPPKDRDAIPHSVIQCHMPLLNEIPVGSLGLPGRTIEGPSRNMLFPSSAGETSILQKQPSLTPAKKTTIPKSCQQCHSPND